MAANVSTTKATPQDIPDMITIQRESMEPDPLRNFLYGHHHEGHVRMHSHSLSETLGKEFTHPTNRSYILKAVESTTEIMLGWSLVSWQAGDITVPPEGHPSDFQAYYRREQTKNWLAACGARPHVVIDGLYVMPGLQGRGIGTLLIEAMFAEYGLEEQTVIVQTVAMSESYFSGLGWKTVASTDIDLSQWAGPGRGFGLHRSPHMVRTPGPLPVADADSDSDSSSIDSTMSTS